MPRSHERASDGGKSLDPREDAGRPSRRVFLKSVLAAPAAARMALGGGSSRRTPVENPDLTLEGAVPLGAAIVPVQFPQPGFIRYDSHCFTVNDHDNFLFGAAFHYPRCPRELW